jgi:hypothetical protein
MVEKEGGFAAADRYLNQRVWDKLGWGTQAGVPSREQTGRLMQYERARKQREG